MISEGKAMFPLHLPRHAYRQRGAVLLVALVFLVLLTLLALGASTNSLLQEHMVAATRSAQLAQMSAETAIRGAEWQLWSNASAVANAPPDCPDGSISNTWGCTRYDLNTALYATGGDVTKFRTSAQWLSGIGLTYKGPDGNGFTNNGATWATADLAQNPQYLIEDLGLERPPGAGSQHESGDTGPNNGGPGQVALHIYRITARATGGNSNTIRVLQSTFDAQTN
jgi:type IV pilus assembly protein PilX